MVAVDDVRRGSRLLDAAIWPAFVALGTGRLVAVSIDGPNSLRSVSDLLIIRSGMEFWPGVTAAMLVAAWSARRSGRTSLDRLADLIPLSIIGYAGFEVACLVRDGCYWPESPLGLQPPGTSTRMLPIGAAAAIAVVAGATLPRRRLGRRPSSIVLLGGVAIVAGVRSLASIWLPHIGGGQSRQHWSSIVVFVTTFFALAVTSVARRPMTPARTERMSVRTSTSVDEPTAIDPPLAL